MNETNNIFFTYIKNFIFILLFSTSLFSFDINAELKEYEKINAIDISEILNGSSKKQTYLHPLVYEINATYSKEIYKKFEYKDINDTNNIFFKSNLTKTEKIIKKDFEKLLKKYMNIDKNFMIYDRNLSMTLFPYKISTFFDFLQSYTYYLKETEDIEYSNQILNKLTDDLEWIMEKSNFVDFLLAIIYFNIFHENNICNYSNNHLFDKNNSDKIKNLLFNKLEREVQIMYHEYSILNSDQTFSKQQLLHALKMYKYYIQQTVKLFQQNKLEELKQFKNKFKPLDANSDEIANIPLYMNDKYNIHAMAKILVYSPLTKTISNYSRTLNKLDNNVNEFSKCVQN